MEETKETTVGLSAGIAEYKGKRYIAIAPLGGPTQLFTPEYVAVFAAMMAWLDSGVRPDAHAVSTLCEAARPRYGAACLFDVSYDPERIQGATIPASRLVGGSPDAAPRP